MTPSDPQTPAAKHPGAAMPAASRERSIVRQLHQVTDVLAGVVLHIRHCRVEERCGDVGDEGGTRAFFPDALEGLVRLDLDREVALTVPDQEIGLTDPLRLAVDREPRAGDDQRPVLHCLQGLPLPVARRPPPR